MMSSTNSLALTGLLVVIGRWAKGEKLEPRVFIAFAFIVLAMLVLTETNERFGNAFALLVLVGATFAYAPAIVRKLGLTGG